jgi:tetratricopeptide (TPR) repeat protein
VLAAIDNDPGRIPTLHDLTGGNPRTLILLYLLLELDAEGDVFRDLERLLDQVTVLYKARVEDLPSQARTVLDAVALAWNPIVAKEVATTAGLTTSAASSQLNRLQKDGIVEKVSISKTSRAAFQLGERFFNLWYLMRHGPRRQRTRLRWLTEFLRGFYTPENLTERAKELFKLENLRGLDRGHYYMAMSDAMDDPGWQKLLGNEARRELERHAKAMGTELGDVVDPAELPTPESANDWWVHGELLRKHIERYDDAESAYRKAIELDPAFAKPWAALGLLLGFELDRLEEGESAFREAIKQDPKFAAPWIGLGTLLAYKLQRHEQAESAYRKAIELGPEQAMSRVILGDLLTYHLDRHEEAETAYRKAIELDPEQARPWVVLGDLLTYHLDRHEEAETAYRKAIELDPEQARPWVVLGDLLTDHLDRHEEAETAYRKAIELDPEQAMPWLVFGDLLTDHLDRHEEAETAYRKAIELDPEQAMPWLVLGGLLTNRLNRHEEAETAIRKSIELDPKSAQLWTSLGVLLSAKFSRHEEAEAAFRTAMKRQPDNILARRCLGGLLMYHLDRYGEAEAVFREIIEIDPEFRDCWDDLGYVLLYFLCRPDEAAAAYAQALKNEPGELIAESNLLALKIVYPESGKDFDGKFDDIVARHSSHGASLLRAIRAMAQDNFGEAVSEFARSLDEGQMEVMEKYRGFVLMFLRLTAERGYGDKLLVWFNEQGLSERYWPLHAAFDAYVHGEPRLMDVNPEVRGAAKRIYGWLDSPRRATHESNNVAQRSVDIASAD